MAIIKKRHGPKPGTTLGALGYFFILFIIKDYVLGSFRNLTEERHGLPLLNRSNLREFIQQQF